MRKLSTSPSNNESFSNLLQNEKTIADIRHEREKELSSFQNSNIIAYYAHNKQLQKEIQKICLEDASSLNEYKTKLEKKYADKIMKGKLNEKEVEKKIAKELNLLSYTLNSQRVVAEKKDQLQLKESKLAIKRAEIEEIKKLEKDYRQNEYSASLKQLEDLKKKRNNLLAQGKDTTNVDKEIVNTEKRVEKNKEKINNAKDNEGIKKVDQLGLTLVKLGIDLKGVTSNLAKGKFSDVKKQFKEGFKDIGKYLKESKAGQITKNTTEIFKDIKSVFAGDISKEAIEERAEAGDKIAEASLKNINAVNNNVNNFINGFKEIFQNTIETYGEYQSKINVRLQGLSKNWQDKNTGIEDTITKAIGSNPLVKMKGVFDNVVKALESGVSFNIEQRAFLETVKDEVAATFDAFNSNLTRIIRLQQQDSTAARLGLESALTQYFNSNFSDTSYLAESISDTVSGSLTEAIAQMGTAQGVEFEYQVQKWLGSLYSVGFGSNTISNIANAIGMLGSGDISGLEGSQMQNLIVMAASRIGLSYADILTEGLDSQTTNKLLASMVDYLQEIADNNNKVVKAQYAEVYGLSASDLIAAKNLNSKIDDIEKSNLNYSGAVNEVFNQMNQFYERMSLSQLLSNAKDNMIYSIGSNIAANPATYALWEITSMIEDVAGGINLPTISAFGNSVDLETTVTNLMRTGIVGVSTLGAIGDIISGVSSTINPSSMLTKLGISKNENAIKTISRGGTQDKRSRKIMGEQSTSSMVGNSAGSDYSDAAITQAEVKGQEKLNQKKEEQGNVSINSIHEYLLNVFDPKITEIEKMISIMNGYNIKTDNWGDFRNENNQNYHATTVTVTGSGENSMLDMNKKNMENVENIRENTDKIVSILNNLISGTSTLSVHTTNILDGLTPSVDKSEQSNLI